MTNQELDEAVARAKGWLLLADRKGRRWNPCNCTIGLIKFEDYTPSTNWQQAGELLEEMKGDLMYKAETEKWVCFYEPQLDGRYVVEDTPQRAICLAYIGWGSNQ